MAVPGLRIELARPSDVARLPTIEARAAARFAPEDLPPSLAVQTVPFTRLQRAQTESRLIVARHARAGVVGFALLERVDGKEIRLEELDVDPGHGRRGIGRALVEAAVERARKERTPGPAPRTKCAKGGVASPGA